MGCWLLATSGAEAQHSALAAFHQHPLSPTRLGTGEELPEVAQALQRQPHEPVNPHACRLLVAQSPAGCFPLTGVLAGYISRNALTMRHSQCVHWRYPFHQHGRELVGLKSFYSEQFPIILAVIPLALESANQEQPSFCPAILTMYCEKRSTTFAVFLLLSDYFQRPACDGNWNTKQP